MDTNPTRGRDLFVLCSVLTLITVALFAYSQTRAFAWDEGFHILTAQLILHGKRPYIDFVFSQTPLNAYWNAFWMGLLGESWKVPHGVAALCSAASASLVSLYVFLRFPVASWRLPAAVTTAALTGLNSVIFRFGGVAQAYGLGLLTSTGAWWCALLSVERSGWILPALCGALCGMGAESSLLVAPVTPILLLWILVYNRAGRGVVKALAFLSGVLVAWIPVFRLFLQGPEQVKFGIIDYNLKFRQLDWPEANQQNLEVLISWIDSGPALVLLLLAVSGILFVRFRSEWKTDTKAEFLLCVWLSAGLGLYLLYVRPTFERYFLFTVPFLSILAVAGLFFIASQFQRSGTNPGHAASSRSWLASFVPVFLICLGLGKGLYEERDDTSWSDMEELAQRVSALTPPGGRLFADEMTYFLTRRTPPSGMEMENAHKFDFAPARLSLLHLMPQAQLDREVAQGLFSTLETCRDADYLAEHHYAAVYREKVEAGGCFVFVKPANH